MRVRSYLFGVWLGIGGLGAAGTTVVVVTDQRTFATAPGALQQDVVPAAWIISEDAPGPP